MSSAVQCASCASVNPRQNAYCSRCGAPLPAQPIPNASNAPRRVESEFGFDTTKGNLVAAELEIKRKTAERVREMERQAEQIKKGAQLSIHKILRDFQVSMGLQQFTLQTSGGYIGGSEFVNAEWKMGTTRQGTSGGMSGSLNTTYFIDDPVLRIVLDVGRSSPWKVDIIARPGFILGKDLEALRRAIQQQTGMPTTLTP